MKSEELKSLNIVFVGIISFSLFTTSTYINYHIYAYTQDGNQPYNTTSLWSTGVPLPTPRSEIAGAALNGKIYIIGGFDETGQSTTTVEVYDPIADRWTEAAPLPQPTDHTAAASYEGKLYVVGGGYLSADALSDKLFRYDPTNDKWTEGPNLPTAHGALTANFINGFCMQ
jgi:N-acetylneuraminic acid mutarotase